VQLTCALLHLHDYDFYEGALSSAIFVTTFSHDMHDIQSSAIIRSDFFERDKNLDAVVTHGARSSTRMLVVFSMICTHEATGVYHLPSTRAQGSFEDHAE
jgi:hypothetical protein